MKINEHCKKNLLIFGTIGIILLTLFCYFKNNKDKGTYTVSPYLPNYFSLLVDWTLSPSGEVIMMGYLNTPVEEGYITVTDGNEDIKHLFSVTNNNSLNDLTKEEVEAFAVDKDNKIYVMKRKYQWVDGKKLYESLAWLDGYTIDGEYLGEVKSFLYEGNKVKSIYMIDGTLYIHENPNKEDLMSGTTYIYDGTEINTLGEPCWGNIAPIDGYNMYYINSGYIWNYNAKSKEKKMISQVEGLGQVGLYYNCDSQDLEVQNTNTLWKYDKRSNKLKQIIRNDKFPYLEEDLNGKFYKNKVNDYFVANNTNREYIYKISKNLTNDKWTIKNTYQIKEAQLDGLLWNNQWLTNSKDKEEKILLGESNDGKNTYNVNSENLEVEKVLSSFKDFITQDGVSIIL